MPLNKKDHKLKEEVQKLLDANYPESNKRPSDRKYRQDVLNVLKRFTDDVDKSTHINLKAQLKIFRAEMAPEEASKPVAPQRVLPTKTISRRTVTIEETVVGGSEDHTDNIPLRSSINPPGDEKETCMRMAFVQFLKTLKDQLKSRGGASPTCFISYAWETNADENKKLQERLEQLRSDLYFLKVDVKLDIHNMDRDIQKYMVENIAKVDNIFLIGTPRLKERFNQSSSNLALEVREALKKSTDTLVPLWFSGTSFQDCFPDGIEKSLVRDFRDPAKYMASMSQTDNPIGLIPSVLKLRDDREYLAILSSFMSDLKLIEGGQLTVKDLQQRGEKLDAANSAHTKEKPKVERKSQKIVTTIGENFVLEEGAQVNISGMVVEGVSVSLNNVGSVDQLRAVHKDLSSIIEADKEVGGLKGLKVAKGASITAQGAKTNAVTFSYNFAQQPAGGDAGSAQTKKVANIKPPKGDIELLRRAKATATQAFDGFVDEFQKAMVFLDTYDNRLLKVKERTLLQQYIADKELLFQIRPVLREQYEDDYNDNLEGFIIKYGEPGGVLTDDQRTDLKEHAGLA